MRSKYAKTLSGLLAITIMLSGCTPDRKNDRETVPIAERRKNERSGNAVIEKKIDELIGQMTVAEKIGQMMQMNASEISTEQYWADAKGKVVFKIDTTKLGRILRRYHTGSFINGIAVPGETWFTYYKEIQDENMKFSRLKIPVLYGIDHMHGANYLEGSTIFPHGINTAATYNNQFPADMAHVTAIETADLGHLWLFAPVLDVGRTPLWGRYYETLGESPYVAKTMGSIFVKAVQNDSASAPYHIAATAKHFLGYSDPKYGWDRSDAEISDQMMYEVFIPPFKAAIDAGIKSVMLNSGSINGEPVHSSERLVTTLLRDELKFKGVVVTDWEDIIRLYHNHKTAEDEKDATYQAIMAGVDVAMTPYTTNFGDIMLALVNEGKITEERLDLSVSRVLRMKMEIGLFENPYPRSDRFSRIGQPGNRAKALEAARESIVLMKNEKHTLPLDAGKMKNILVAGPTANSKNALTGGWTLRWMTTDEAVFPAAMPTLYTALQKEFSNVSLASSLSELKTKSSKADAIVIGVGEQAYAEGFGSIHDISLPDDQIELIKSAQSTGKPVIVVVIAGRPRVITKIYKDCSAVLFAGLPGFEGGQAIAEILSGKVNPSARMSFNYPYGANHLVPHNHKPTEVLLAHGIENPVALVRFGEGLSYTTFEYSNLRLSDSVLTSRTGEITATITVKNTGAREGKEAVLWFLSDEVGSVARPVRDLKFYEKKMIKAGEAADFSFIIRPDESLSFPSKKGDMLLENGGFTLTVGNLKARFKLKI